MHTHLTSALSAIRVFDASLPVIPFEHATRLTSLCKTRHLLPSNTWPFDFLFLFYHVGSIS